MLRAQIESYFYTAIKLSANRDLADSDESISTTLKPTDLNFNFEQKFNDDGKLNVQLNLFTVPQNEKKLPYNFNIEVIGLFDVTVKDQDATRLESEVVSLLQAIVDQIYGVTREKIHSLTSQMPFGPLTLPMSVISFEMKSKKNQTKTATKSKSTNKKPA